MVGILAVAGALLWRSLDTGALLAGDLTERELVLVGERFFRNECGSDPAKLTHWNRGETFISLGILHMLWYPGGAAQSYRETFPAFIHFCQANGQAVPPWILDALRTGCPWPDRTTFYRQADGELARSLRQFLARTTHLQAAFAHRRFIEGQSVLLSQALPRERFALAIKLYWLNRSALGVFALIDYVNFKGEGLNPKERYGEQGWGLLQVLQAMEIPWNADGALNQFVDAAKATLTQRVANAPDPAKERRWLPGWHRRLDSYREPLTAALQPPP